MDGKKMRNPHVWLRMAGELAALETLASQILCDREYNEVMDKKAWDRLFRVIHEINEIRSRADTRAANCIILSGPQLFYGSALDKARELAVNFRESLKQEAAERAATVYGTLDDGIHIEPRKFTLANERTPLLKGRRDTT